jgi:hypothetical protein
MSGQGYHLAIEPDQLDDILLCNDADAVLDRTSEILEGSWAKHGTTRAEGGYKDWQVLLCCLTNGTFDPKGGSYPLNKCFFGGKLLVREGSIVNLVMPEEVSDVADALDSIDRADFRVRYTRLPEGGFRSQNWAREEEYQYDLWIKLNKLRRFYRRAAGAGQAILFYTDVPLDYFYKTDRGSKSVPSDQHTL